MSLAQVRSSLGRWLEIIECNDIFTSAANDEHMN